jgi:glycosyltransferase involved in cell wall biosynthesis
MNNNLVSIITPVYNASKFVGITIESVLKQSYQNWEMILVNDGSKDNSAEVIQKYVDKDSRIILVSQDNAGSAAARNNGIRRANGRYLCLLDADDTWEPNFIEEQLKLLKEKNTQLVYSSHTRIDENGEQILKPFIVPSQVDYNSLLKTCSISCLTAMYDTVPYGKIYLREDLKSLRDDYAFWLEIIKKVGVAYGNSKILANYRIFKTQATGNKKKMIKPQFLVYYQVEKLGLLKSLYYTFTWAFAGIKKYYSI